MSDFECIDLTLQDTTYPTFQFGGPKTLHYNCFIFHHCVKLAIVLFFWLTTNRVNDFIGYESKSTVFSLYWATAPSFGIIFSSASMFIIY